MILEKKRAETRFGEIAYTDRGEGPVALFVHGVFLNSYFWRHVVDRVCDARRCVAVDLMSHGDSQAAPDQDISFRAQAEMLNAFCESLGFEQVDLVANDTGGAIAQIFAARHPHRLATLTLTNCDTAENLPPEDFKPMVELAAAGALAPSAVELFGDLDAAAQLSFGSSYEHLDRIDPGIVRSYLEPCIGTLERARQFERFLVALDAGDLVAVMPQLRKLTVPTLVVWGTGDTFFDVSWAYWLRDTIPGATRVITVDDARLLFPEERPMDLVPHLEQHWSAAATPRGVS